MILLRSLVLALVVFLPAVVQGADDVLWMGFKYSVAVKYIGPSKPGLGIPRPRSLQMPDYPINMLESALSGDVLGTVVVTEDGSVRSVKVVEASSPEFGEAAKKAMTKWFFDPAKSGKDGVAVCAELMCRVEFRASE